jgi:heme/copper-type cytochrome/quinol oxidase subunit 2
MNEQNPQADPLRSRLKSALTWGWVLFGLTILAVPAFGLLAVRSAFTTCSPPACASNHGGDAASLAALVIYLLDFVVTIVFLVFGVRSLRSLRRNGADSSRSKPARRVRTSSIIQLSILSTPVILLFITFLLYLCNQAQTYWR